MSQAALHACPFVAPARIVCALCESFESADSVELVIAFSVNPADRRRAVCGAMKKLPDARVKDALAVSSFPTLRQRCESMPRFVFGDAGAAKLLIRQAFRPVRSDRIARAPA
jgi:hypothetical protein